MIQYHFVTKPSSYGAYISGPAFYKWWLAIMNLADSIFSFFSTLIYSKYNSDIYYTDGCRGFHELKLFREAFRPGNRRPENRE